MILTRRHLSPIAAGVAIALLTSSAAYFWAGEHAWRGAGAEQAARTWPAVEMFRLANVLTLTNKSQVELAGIGGFASTNIKDWTALETDAEFRGTWAAAGVGPLTIFLVLSAFLVGDWRHGTRDLRRLKKAVSKLAAPIPLTIGPIALPEPLEARHILLSGSTGTGKSVTIDPLLWAARARELAIVCVDRGGAFVSRHYRKGDVILNFFDHRCPILSPLSHAHDASTIDFYASSLFPVEGLEGNSVYFSQAAKVIYVQILSSMRDATNADLWRVFCNPQALSAALHNTPAANYLQAKEWPSIFNTVLNAVQDLKYLPAAGTYKNSFSPRDFAEAADGASRGRVLWMVMPHTQASALGPLATSTLSTFINAIQGLGESKRLRALVLTDELGNIPPIADLQTALTEGRKFGLLVVSGIQTDAQLRKKYGRDGDQILKSCYTTKVFFRTEDPEAAEWCSRTLSDVEVLEQTHSVSESARGDGSSRSERRVLKRAVPAAEFLKLPDLSAYIKPGPYGHARITVPVFESPSVVAGFIGRKPGDPPTVAEASQTAADNESGGSATTAPAPSLRLNTPALDLDALTEISDPASAVDDEAEQ